MGISAVQEAERKRIGKGKKEKGTGMGIPQDFRRNRGSKDAPGRPASSAINIVLHSLAIL